MCTSALHVTSGNRLPCVYMCLDTGHSEGEFKLQFCYLFHTIYTFKFNPAFGQKENLIPKFIHFFFVSIYGLGPLKQNKPSFVTFHVSQTVSSCLSEQFLVRISGNVN